MKISLDMSVKNFVWPFLSGFIMLYTCCKFVKNAWGIGYRYGVGRATDSIRYGLRRTMLDKRVIIVTHK